MKSIEDRISIAVTKLYERISQNGKPNTQNMEFTVLSAIVACNSHSNEIAILSLATGTKCAGKEEIGNSGCILRDCHAEVIARRSFIRYLFKCALLYLEYSTGKQEVEEEVPLGILEASLDPAFLFQLKSNWHIWLYVSDSPCGDASIYDRQFGRSFSGTKSPSMGTTILPTLHELNLSTNSTINFKDNNKDLLPNKNSSNCIISPLIHQQIGLGDVRLKPGRQDMKIELRSESMSCSDKVARWSVLGLQGGLLSNIIAPIPLAGIVIGKDPLALPGTQYTAAVRAFHHRLSPMMKLQQQSCLTSKNISSSFSPNYNNSNSNSNNNNDSHSNIISAQIPNTSSFSNNIEKNLSTDTVTDNITLIKSKELLPSSPIIIISQESFCSGKCNSEYQSLLKYGTEDTTGNTMSSRKRKRKNNDIVFTKDFKEENNSTMSGDKCQVNGKVIIEEEILLIDSFPQTLQSFPLNTTNNSIRSADDDGSSSIDEIKLKTMLESDVSSIVTVSDNYDDLKVNQVDNIIDNIDSNNVCDNTNISHQLLDNIAPEEKEISPMTITDIIHNVSLLPCPCNNLLAPLTPFMISIKENIHSQDIKHSGCCMDVNPLTRPPVPCGFCINWIRDVYYDNIEKKEEVTKSNLSLVTAASPSPSSSSSQNKPSTTKSISSLDHIENVLKHVKPCVYHESDAGVGGRGTVEVLSSRNGLRQGAGRPKNGDLSKICSRLCKREMALLMLRLFRSTEAQKFPLLVSLSNKINQHSISRQPEISTSVDFSVQSDSNNPSQTTPPNTITTNLSLSTQDEKGKLSYHNLKLLCMDYQQKRNIFLSVSPFHRWNIANPDEAEGFTIAYLLVD